MIEIDLLFLRISAANRYYIKRNNSFKLLELLENLKHPRNKKNNNNNIHPLTMDSTDYDNDEVEQEQINSTILEFLSTFHSISTEPQSITDLSDGVALFEALSEM